MPRLHQTQVNGPLVLFALALSVATALLFGALPALRGARPPADVFRPARSSHGRSARLGSRMLVGSQVAMTVLLLVASGLFLRSLGQLERVDPGFVPENTLAVGVSLPARSYSEEADVLGFYQRLFARLEALPGVESVAAASRLPFKEQRWSSDFSAAGWPADRYGVGVRHDEVTSGYFATMGIPLLAGRDFSATDDRAHPLVVVINEVLASRYFGDEDPLGQRIAFDREPGPDSYWWTIVGVVGDVRRLGPGTPPPMSIYAPFSQDWAPGRTMHVMMRTASEPLAQVGAVRAAVAELDPNLALVSTHTMDGLRAGALARDRFLLLLLTAFAGVTLLLAIVGVYGAVSYATGRRTQEIGIRMAMGAGGRDVARSVLVEGLTPVIAGLLVGLAGALALSGILTGLLYEISPVDPTTYAAAAALLLAVAAFACGIPARRATLVDPVVALRNE